MAASNRLRRAFGVSPTRVRLITSKPTHLALHVRQKTYNRMEKTTSFITKLTKKFLQYKKSIQKRVIVTQDN